MKNQKSFFFCATLCFAVLGGNSHGSDITVSDIATLQSVIDNCSPGDRIFLSDNVHRPDYTIVLTNGITLAGSSFTNCVIKPTGNRRVIEISGTGSCISNITITGGSMTLSTKDERASGIVLNGGVVSHCMISNNVTSGSGQAIRGAGICVIDGIVELSIVAENKNSNQYSFGSGVYIEGGMLRDCLIKGNTQNKNLYGGGICMRGGTVSHCVVTGNSAYCGGGISLGGNSTYGPKASILVDRCLVYGNTASNNGGGIASVSAAKVNNVQYKWTLRQTTVANNSCTYSKGGAGGINIQFLDSVSSCESCIFADNNQTFDDGSDGYPNWSRSTSITVSNLAKKFKNCLFGNGSAALGTDSISGSAAFESLVKNDYHLKSASDAINNALDSANVTADLDGNAVIDGLPDIGCYEANFANDPFSCSILYSASSIFEGASVSLSATPVNQPAGVSIRYVWTLTDGGDNTVQAQGVSATATLTNAAVYSVSIRAYNNDTSELLTETFGESTIRIYPPVVYANPGDDIADIAADLADGQRLIIAEGTYESATTISVSANASVEGAGLDRTVISFTSTDKSFRIRGMNTRVSGVTIRGGRSSGSEDVVWVEHGTLTESRITQCIVENAEYGNNALKIDAGALVECCIIDHNTNRTSRGKTAWTYSRASAAVVNGTMRNCLIHSNYSAASEGTVYVKGTMENCTVVNNINNGNTMEAVALMLGNNATIRNTVAARNLSPNWTTNHVDNIHNVTIQPTGSPPNWVAQGMHSGSYLASASYNCWGESPETYGTHCADGSKISFINPEGGNWRIGVNSSCRDAGVYRSWMEDAIDLAGQPRIFHEIVDIGCYENQSMPHTVLMLR